VKSASKLLAAATGFAIAASAGSGAAMAQTDPAAIAPAPVAVSQPVVQGAAPSAVAPTYAAPAYGAPAYAGPPPMTGAVAGSTAADRDGDGIVDGYYTADGMYHPIMAPAPMPAPQLAYRRGERG
jgi:hypothetical protein